MKKIFKTISLIIAIMFCSSFYLYSKDSQVLPKFEESSKGYNIIRYSNVVVNYNKKILIIPIYGGIYEDITYEKLKEQKKKNNYIFNLFFPTQKGKVEETFFNILNFYTKSLFKNIDISQPTEIGNEGAWIIWYDFVYNDIPCSVMFFVGLDEKETLQRQNKLGYKQNDDLKINMLGFDEKSPGIGMLINIGKPSPFKKK